jgi:hypothetical protein
MNNPETLATLDTGRRQTKHKHTTHKTKSLWISMKSNMDSKTWKKQTFCAIYISETT